MAVNFGKSCAFGAAGLVGSFIAVVGDIAQKDTASAVVKIATSVNSNLEILIPTVAWAGVLVVLGVVLAMIFEPKTAKTAFFTGASVIALIMTATPYSAPPTSPDGTVTPVVNGEAMPRIVPAAFNGALWPAQSTDQVALSVALSVPADAPQSPATITLFDNATKEVWRVTVTLHPGRTVTQSWSLKPIQHDRNIDLRVEAKGYAIETRSVSIAPADTEESVAIALNRSRTPFYIQKLLRAYKF